MGTLDYRTLTYQMNGNSVSTSGMMVVADFVLYGRAITPTEMGQLNAYFNNKWGLSYQ